MDDWITVKEAAELYGTTDGAIYYRIKKRIVETRQEPGRPLLVSRAGILACRRIVRGAVLPDDWITAKEAAALLGIPLSTIYSRVRMGELTPQLQPMSGLKHTGKQYFSRRQVMENLDGRPKRTQRRRTDWTYNPTREECCYFAGLLDGEGCITVSVTVHPGADHYCIRVCIMNTDRRLLEWIVPRFGGSIYGRQRQNPRWRDCYQWIVQNHVALEILRRIEPFLIGKGEQARLAIRLQEQIESIVASRWYPVTPEQIAERESIRIAINELNRRGPRPAPDP